MPQAVAHVLFAIILLDLIRDYALKDRKKLPLHFIFIGGVAGLLPDADIPVYWLLKNVLGLQVEWFHRTLTHSILLPVTTLIITLVLLQLTKKKNFQLFFAVITFGFATHILLDGILTDYIPLFYPFSQAQYGLNLLRNLGWPSLVEGIDAIILLVWLWDLDRRHQLRDYM
ncbi:MAG: metal-dependent hydrolase [Nanoarchaeota archaeon]|nr:metal-dependent hydrolase [Nanoarchaeota archaeon]